MWVCNKHIKEMLETLECPHVSKAPKGIICSLCNKSACANLFYTHKYTLLKKIHSSKNSPLFI